MTGTQGARRTDVRICLRKSVRCCNMDVERMFETGVVEMTTMVSTGEHMILGERMATGRRMSGDAVRSGAQARVLEPRRVRRPRTVTRRGPIAVPVSGTRRPVGVPAPSLAAGARVLVGAGVHVGVGRQAVLPQGARSGSGAAVGFESDAWEWTDRGLAVVMGLGLMVVLAALVAIVTMTLSVTG